MLIAAACSWCFLCWWFAGGFMLEPGVRNLPWPSYWKALAIVVAAPVSVPIGLAFIAVVSLIDFRAE